MIYSGILPGTCRRFYGRSLGVHVSVLVRRHLRQTQHCILALQTVIMRLFARVLTLHSSARLTGRKFLKTRRRDTVQLGMLPPMSDHLICVCADEVTLQTMKMWRLVLHWSEGRCIRALSPPTRHVGPILLEITPHQGIQSLVPRGMLYKTSFVAERITTILTHAVEVCLMLSVAAMMIPAVLVEPKSVTTIK